MTAHAPALADRTARRLRLANAGLVLLHGAQAAVLLALTTPFTIAVTETFAEGPPGSPPPAPEALLEPRLGVLVAGFLLLAALDHLVVALPRVSSVYASFVARGRNPFRWVEYSVSASLMVVLIGFLAGITDVTAVVAVIGANAAMIGFGHRSERVNEGRDRALWQPFVLGCLVGAVPWLVIAVQFVGAETEAAGEGVPTFVYGIFASLLVLFSSFAVVQALQLRALSRGGRFADPARVEGAYLVLSLVAKSALAWQVFANVLVG